MYELSDLQARVYFVIRNHGPIGPTNIGLHLEFQHDYVSSSVRRPIAALMRKGLITREAKNKRVVTYRTTHDNAPPLILTAAAGD